MSDKEVKIKITGDISDLQKKLKSIEDSLNNLGKNGFGNNKSINSYIDDASKAKKVTDELGDSVNDISDSLRKAGKSSGFDEVAADIGKIDKKIETVTDNAKDFSKSISNIDTKQMGALDKQLTNVNDNVSKAKENFEGMSKIADGFSFDSSFFSDANKKLAAISKKANGEDIKSGGLLSEAVGGLVSGSVAGKMLVNTMEGVTSGIRDVVEELNRIDDNTSLSDKVAMFDKFGKEMDEARAKAEKLSKEIKGLEEDQAKKNAALNESRETIKATDGDEGRRQEVRRNIEALEDEIRATERLREAYEKLYHNNFRTSDYKKYNSLGDVDDELRRIQKARDEYKGDAISKNFLFPETELEKYIKDMEKFNKSYTKFMGQVSDGPEEWGGSGKLFDLDFDKYSHSMLDLQEYIDGIDDYINQYEKKIKELKEVNESHNAVLNDTGASQGRSRRGRRSRRNANSTVNTELTDAMNDLEELKDMRKFIEKHMQTYIKGVGDEFGVKLDIPIDVEFLWDYDNNDYKKLLEIQEALSDKLTKAQSEYNKELKELDNISDDNGRAEAIEKESRLTKELAELTDNLTKKRKELAQVEEDVKTGAAKEDEYKSKLHEQMDAYTKLNQKMQEVFETEDMGVFAQKRIAQAVQDAGRAIQMMIGDLKDLDKYDLDFSSAYINLCNLDAEIEEHMKNVKLLSYDNLINDIDRLGKSVADKTEKLNELKEANKEMDDQSRRTVNGINRESQAIREFAENAGFALKYYEEFAGTDREIQIEGNHKSLESILKPEKLREYNEAVREYLNLIEETGGAINKRFLDDEGKFDVNKYIADYERFGKPITQLIANFKALRQQVLEYLKVQDDVKDAENNVSIAKMYKEEAEEAQRAAKARYELAEAADKAAKKAKEQAQSEEEINKATRESGKAARELWQARQELNEANRDAAKYTQELADAQKELEKAQERAAKVEKESTADRAKAVKEINEQAQALRKLGAAVDDIELDEIRDIDKVLGSKLKNLFSNDLPKSFGEIGEYIKTAFGELNDLDFGNFGGLLKDAGSGFLKNIFAKLPAEAKLAAAAIVGVTVALNKLYESGKQQFFSGLSNAAQKLQPLINAFQSIGREAITAFESITGTNVDLSSLMEIGPNFEYQMQKVGTIAGSNTRQLEELTKAAEHLGGTTQFSATQVGEAFEYMAMAGYTTEEMLSSIEGVLNLSIASGSDFAKTADIVTDYMTALGMEASNTSEFVDKLAATVTSSNTTVELFGTSMKQVASQAGSLRISMTDLSTAIGLQANAGVKGSKAGTALKNILNNMTNPTKKQAEALKGLGFEVNKLGTYFELTEDDAVDLEATMMKFMDNIGKKGSDALFAQFAGREALPGFMALISQGKEGWKELSATIENSTGTVQYWNECMSLAGKSGDDAVKVIDNMKTVFAETEREALGLGLSTKDLSHAIAILGDDGNVTSENVQHLMKVINTMNTATGEAEEQWRSLDKTGKNAINTNYDYDATIAKIAADTQGLSQEKKKLIKSQLDENMSLEEANAVLKEYGLTAERTSFSTLTYAEKLGYLRDTLGETLDETEKTTLKNLGLSDSIDEISEVLAMSGEEFEAYTDNLENVKGMAEQMADAMDEVTKASLLNLASAIENVCIAAFNKFKPVLKGVVDEVNKFFDVWHNFEDNEFTFDGLEKALDALANGGKFKNNEGENVIIQGIKSQEGKIKQAVVDMFAGINRFINDGSLKSLLDIGTSVVQSICKGIQEAKSNKSLDEAIDGAIKNICNWIETNGPAIEEAGKTIIDSITNGIKNNESAITGAMNEICNIMSSWASSSGDLKASAGLFAEQFVGFAVESMWNKFKSWIKEKFTAFGELFSGPFTIGGGAGGMAMNLWGNIMEGIFGVDPIGEAWKWIKSKFSGFNILQAVKDTIFPVAYADSPGGGESSQIKPEQIIKIPTLGEIKEFITSKFSGFSIKDFIKNLLINGAGAGGGTMGAIGGAMLKAADLFGEWNPIEDIKGWLEEKVGDWGITKWFKEKFGNKDGKGEKVNVSDLLELDTEKLADIETQLNSLSTTASTVSTNVVTAFNNITNTARTSFVNMANIVRNQLVSCTNIVRNQAVNMANIVRNQALNMSNIFRNQFVNMANIARNQMVNVSNIVRNQAISWSNVIRNQVTNARNTFTSQFLSMAAVARTQMVNISNIVRNQAISWSNVIRNQTANMKASFTAAFSGLSSIAASQMSKCLSTVRSYMSQIRAATAQTMTMNFRVNKTVTTTNVTRSVAQKAARTMSNIARSGPSLIAPQAVAIGGGIVGGSDRVNNGLGSANALQLSIPLTVDGREIARATASYNQEELAKMSKRNSRRRGE